MTKNDMKNNAVQITVRERPNLDNSSDQLMIKSDNAKIYIENRYFEFDKVLGPRTTQAEVYNQVVNPLVHKCIEGFHCTVLAYGQTGTGKSYTMGLQTDLYAVQEDGMISRALAELLNVPKDLDINVSFIEIYNERVYDLLCTSNTTSVRQSVKKLNMNQCTQRNIKNANEARLIINEGNRNRHVRSTKLNSISSRSHAIFTIHLSNGPIKSTLNMVDLAGSEGIKKTGHEGLALTESVNINQGLLNVRKVLQALTQGNRIIPYRDSVLTYALKDSLKIDSFFTLLACISSLKIDFQETIATLRFAQEAKLLPQMPRLHLMASDSIKSKTPQKSNSFLYTPSNHLFVMPTSSIKKRKEIGNNTFSTPNKKKQSEYLRQHATTLPITPVHEKNDRELDIESTFDDNSLRDSKCFSNISSSTSIGDLRHSTPFVGAVSNTNCCCSKEIASLLSRLQNIEKENSVMFESIDKVLNKNTNLDTISINKEMQTEIQTQQLNRQPLQEISVNNFQFFSPIKQISRKIINDDIDLGNHSAFKSPDHSITLLKETYIDSVIEMSTVIDDATIIDMRKVNEENIFKQPELLLNRKGIKKQLETNDINPKPLRRSVRLSSRNMEICSNLEQSHVETSHQNSVFEKNISKPMLKSRRSIRLSLQRANATEKKSKIVTKNDLTMKILVEKTTKIGAQSKKKALNEHKNNILNILNTGNMQELQILPMIGRKTSYHIVTHRCLNGKFSCLDDVSKMPIWRGSSWSKFLALNNIKS